MSAFHGLPSALNPENPLSKNGQSIKVCLRLVKFRPDRKIGCLLDPISRRQPTQGNGWIGKQRVSETPGKKEREKGGACVGLFFQELSAFSSHLYIRLTEEKSCGSQRGRKDELYFFEVSLSPLKRIFIITHFFILMQAFFENFKKIQDLRSERPLRLRKRILCCAISGQRP